MSEGPSYDDRRLSFGAGAQEYARWRPGYAAAAVDWVLEAVSGVVERVVDVGAGTGALTEALVARGLRVDAVEPDQGMLAVLRERVPGAAAREGAAEGVPLPDGSADAAFLAQAWHWVDPPRAAAELARVVRPGGVLGILWNVRLMSPGWTQELGDLIGGEDSMRAVRPTVDEDCDDDPDPIVLGAPWSASRRREFGHEVTMTTDSLVALAGTYSYVRLRPDVDEVLAEVRRIGERHTAATGRAELVMPYVTLAYRLTRA